MKVSVYIDERCVSEYIKLTLSVFFQHQPHKHKFPFFFKKKKKIFLQNDILNYLRPVFWGYIPSQYQNLQFNKWESFLPRKVSRESIDYLGGWSHSRGTTWRKTGIVQGVSCKIVFIKLVLIKHWLFFFFFLVAPCSMQNLSSRTRDRAQVPCGGNMES